MSLKTIDIKGKDYVPVVERIRYFNEAHASGRIVTEVSYQDSFVRCKATVTPDMASPERFFTGHSEEDRSQGTINRTNATENCETSAIGRALGIMGIGIIESVASADEVVHAIAKQERIQEQPTYHPEPSQSGDKVCPKCGKAHNGRFPKCIDCWKAEKNEQLEASGVGHPINYGDK